jgi:nicotinate-nucleotide adenylyltransferase
MMKIGIMGGTFDPIHIGHLIAAEHARENMGLDEVWFMPSHQPPHKSDVPKATAEQRLRMVELAIGNHPAFRTTDIEFRREGKSYTVDTVHHLIDLFPQHSFYFIIGADMVHFLPKWYQIDEIVKHVRFIGLSRPGFSSDTSDYDKEAQDILDKVHFVPMPLIEISSTLVRESMKRSKSIRYLVPDSVRQFIEENRLYES